MTTTKRGCRKESREHLALPPNQPLARLVARSTPCTQVQCAAMASADPTALPSIEHLIRKSVKRTHTLFSAEEAFLGQDDSDRA